jgi:hypothetical protein
VLLSKTNTSLKQSNSKHNYKKLVKYSSVKQTTPSLLEPVCFVNFGIIIGAIEGSSGALAGI